MRIIYIILLCMVILSCKEEDKDIVLTANDIINKSIEVSGGDRFNHSEINFYFRDKIYFAKREGGQYLFSRSFKENGDSISDFLNNSGFKRLVDQQFIRVEDSMVPKYSASVNSVHYFSVLPYGLNDRAVNKILISEAQLNNRNYYKIKVTFDEEGGGEDFEDVFFYWVDKQNFRVKYLAYSYNEEDGIGMRFREAYNERYINGIRFVDYNNYKPINKSIKLEDLDKAFGNGQLQLLSKIELLNIKVKLPDISD